MEQGCREGGKGHGGGSASARRWVDPAQDGYEPPRLVVLGTVAELTAGVGINSDGIGTGDALTS